MALPRYKRANIPTQSIGGITPVAAQAEARTMETLSGSLDRLSRFAFGQAEIQAQIEGEEYGAEKAPSAQQMIDAFAAGEDIEEFIPGDTMTVFGRSARKSAITAVSNSFEATARQDIANLSMLAESTAMPIDQFQVQMADLIDGYAAPLLEISPQTSRRFRASTAITGNAAIQSHAEFLSKKAAKEAELAAILDIDEVINTHIPKVVANGSTIDPISQDVTPLSQHIEFYRNKIIESGQSISDRAILDSKLKAFDEAVTAQFNTQVTSYVMEDPLKRFSEIRTGVITDPKVQDIFATMTEEQRVGAYDAAMSAASRDLSYTESLASANERLRGELVDKLRPQVVRARARGDTEEIDRLLQEIEDLQPEVAASMEEAIYTEGGIDSAGAILSLEQLAASGELTMKDIEDARKNQLITFGTYDRFVSKIEAQRNADHQEAMTIAKNALGYPDRAIVNLVDEDREALKRIAEIENELIIKGRTDKDFNRVEYVLNRIKAIKEAGPSEAEVKAAQNKVKALRKLFRLPETTTIEELRTELNERVDGNKFNAAEAATYRSAFKLLEGLE